MYERCTRKERYFDAAGVLQIAPSPRGMARLPNSRSLDMITNARRKDADFVDFLSKSLRWEPEDRLRLEDCLAHPWLCEQTAQGSSTHPDSTPSTQLASRVETPIRADSATLQDEEETVQFTVAAPVVSHLSMHRPDPMKGISDDDMIRKIKMSTSKAVQEEQEDELGRKLALLVG
jgi:serine/threonine protein kinase